MYHLKMHILGTAKEYLDIIRNVKRKRDKMYITDILMNFLTCHQTTLDYCIEKKFGKTCLNKIEELLKNDYTEDQQWFVSNLLKYKQKFIDNQNKKN